MNLLLPSWKTLRVAARVVSNMRFLLVLATTIVFPIFECVFVNLLTETEAEKEWLPLSLLIAAGGLHLILAALVLLGEWSNPLTNLIDGLEARQELDRVAKELKRRSDAYTLIRSAIDTLNLQTCQHNPTLSDAISQGITPIMQRVTCSIGTAFGVTGDQFTVEVYLYDTAIHPYPKKPSTAVQFYFFSPHINNSIPHNLGCRAPYRWGLSRTAPGVCNIKDDPTMFYEHNEPARGLYFRKFATAPIYESCSPGTAGLLVVTSMQDEPFGEDILDIMRFISSILSQYLASHNRCVYEYYQEQKRVETRRKRQEGRKRREGLAVGSADGVNQVEIAPGDDQTDDEEVLGTRPHFSGTTTTTAAPSAPWSCSLHATILEGSFTKARTIELVQQGDSWVGENIQLFRDRVVIDGETYAVTWGYPLSITVKHKSATIVITC